ncbi:hypothetical protein D7Y15_14820 [Corallococcus sp. AB030]|nr:hypothetical protein D7Y15_14820 [Corallococcus sp. AB030]
MDGGTAGRAFWGTLLLTITGVMHGGVFPPGCSAPSAGGSPKANIDTMTFGSVTASGAPAATCAMERDIVVVAESSAGVTVGMAGRGWGSTACRPGPCITLGVPWTFTGVTDGATGRALGASGPCASLRTKDGGTLRIRPGGGVGGSRSKR